MITFLSRCYSRPANSRWQAVHKIYMRGYSHNESISQTAHRCLIGPPDDILATLQCPKCLKIMEENSKRFKLTGSYSIILPLEELKELAAKIIARKDTPKSD